MFNLLDYTDIDFIYDSNKIICNINNNYTIFNNLSNNINKYVKFKFNIKCIRFIRDLDNISNSKFRVITECCRVKNFNTKMIQNYDNFIKLHSINKI